MRSPLLPLNLCRSSDLRCELDSSRARSRVTTPMPVGSAPRRGAEHKQSNKAMRMLFILLATATATAQLLLGTVSATGADVPPGYSFKCSYNGAVGADGACKCSDSWTGTYCHALNLGPARNGSGLDQLHAPPLIKAEYCRD